MNFQVQTLNHLRDMKKIKSAMNSDVSCLALFNEFVLELGIFHANRNTARLTYCIFYKRIKTLKHSFACGFHLIFYLSDFTKNAFDGNVAFLLKTPLMVM